MAALPLSIILNLGSLLLGIGAWLWAIAAITAATAAASHRFATFSFGFCVFSLLLQLAEVKNRAAIGDYAAIEDTIGAVVFAAAVLSLITIALNLAALIKTRNK